MIFKRKKRVKLSDVLRVLEPIFTYGSHAPNVHIYFGDSYRCKLYPFWDYDLYQGDKLKFIEYYIDDMNWLRRREFEYIV